MRNQIKEFSVLRWWDAICMSAKASACRSVLGGESVCRRTHRRQDGCRSEQATSKPSNKSLPTQKRSGYRKPSEKKTHWKSPAAVSARHGRANNQAETVTRGGSGNAGQKRRLQQTPEQPVVQPAGLPSCSRKPVQQYYPQSRRRRGLFRNITLPR